MKILFKLVNNNKKKSQQVCWKFNALFAVKWNLYLIWSGAKDTHSWECSQAVHYCGNTAAGTLPSVFLRFSRSNFGLCLRLQTALNILPVKPRRYSGLWDASEREPAPYTPMRTARKTSRAVVCVHTEPRGRALSMDLQALVFEDGYISFWSWRSREQRGNRHVYKVRFESGLFPRSNAIFHPVLLIELFMKSYPIGMIIRALWKEGTAYVNRELYRNRGQVYTKGWRKKKGEKKNPTIGFRICAAY